MKCEPEPVDVGQSFEEFLKEQGRLDEANAAASKRVSEWQRRVSTARKEAVLRRRSD